MAMFFSYYIHNSIQQPYLTTIFRIQLLFYHPHYKLVLKENLIKANELDEILDAYAMTEPEIILIKEAM